MSGPRLKCFRTCMTTNRVTAALCRTSRATKANEAYPLPIWRVSVTKPCEVRRRQAPARVFIEVLTAEEQTRIHFFDASTGSGIVIICLKESPNLASQDAATGTPARVVCGLRTSSSKGCIRIRYRKHRSRLINHCGIDVAAMKSSYLHITDGRGEIRGNGELPAAARTRCWWRRRGSC